MKMRGDFMKKTALKSNPEGTKTKRIYQIFFMNGFPINNLMERMGCWLVESNFFSHFRNYLFGINFLVE